MGSKSFIDQCIAAFHKGSRINLYSMSHDSISHFIEQIKCCKMSQDDAKKKVRMSKALSGSNSWATLSFLLRYAYTITNWMHERLINWLGIETKFPSLPAGPVRYSKNMKFNKIYLSGIDHGSFCPQHL